MDKSPKGPLLNDLNTNHPVEVVKEEEEESSSTELGRKTFEGAGVVESIRVVDHKVRRGGRRGGRGVGKRVGRGGKGRVLNHSLRFKVKLFIKIVMGGTEFEEVPEDAIQSREGSKILVLI
jgi:hypothetical protein